MSRCFADTYYFLALINPKDAAHERAVQFTEGYAGDFVTTQFVLIEVANALSAPAFRERAVMLVESLTGRTEVTVIGASEAWFERGMELYRSRGDKGWSLADCISFVVMQERGIQDALTADHHFEQAGFVALLK